MGISHLVDTNVISEIMRPHPTPQVLTQWQQYHMQVAIATITWHELLTGVYRLPVSKRRQALESLLFGALQNTVLFLPYDRAAAEWHATERARLMQIGQTPSFPDGQIAAIAATNDLILVTRNVRDFSDFTGLSVANWFEEN